MSDRVPITGVRGGSHGLAASYEHARALASSFDGAGNRMRDWARAAGRVLRDGDLVESALLAPWSFAEAELAVLDATTGRDGILVESVGWETDALLIRGAVSAFEQVDVLVAATFEVVDYALGRAVGSTLAAGLPLAVGASVVAGVAYSSLPESLRREARSAAWSGAAVLQDWVVEHPAFVEHLANGGGGLVDGFWAGTTHQLAVGPDGGPPFHATTEAAAALVAALYPSDGRAAVVARDDLDPHDRTGVPTTLAGLLTHLREVSLLSPDRDSPGNGTIEVQTVHGPDGPRHVVYLPGTDDMLTTPASRDADVRDLPTNLVALGGASTTYAEGILTAMTEAGIGPGEPVALVGHSQGGIMAAWLATHPHAFEIGAVVTAGSPIGGMGDYPAGTHVLSLENRGDLVPLTDGEANGDAGNHVTVTFDDRGPDLVDSHDLAHYVAGAGAVDASEHPSLVAELARLRTLGFLGAGDEDTTNRIFQVTREPG